MKTEWNVINLYAGKIRKTEHAMFRIICWSNMENTETLHSKSTADRPLSIPVIQQFMSNWFLWSFNRIFNWESHIHILIILHFSNISPFTWQKTALLQAGYRDTNTRWHTNRNAQTQDKRNLSLAQSEQLSSALLHLVLLNQNWHCGN